MNIFFEYGKNFDRKVFLGHCDIVSWFSDFALYIISRHSVGIVSYFFQIMNEYEETFNPNVLTGHYDLALWLIDFA